jgi:hypothetical protein
MGVILSPIYLTLCTQVTEMLFRKLLRRKYSEAI